MTYLLIALAALALGPVTLNLLRRRPYLAAALDGFVVVAIAGLIFLHFVPQAIEHRQAMVLIALALGLLLPLAAERLLRSQHGRIDRWGLILGLSGLAIHAGLDGRRWPRSTPVARGRRWRLR